jgi:glycosyltransferase involved in cell wall biosynthesis
MKNQQRIIAFHLLNDRSGSPKVLSQIIKSWVKDDKEVLLYTSYYQDGFLSDIPGIQYIKGWYKFKPNPWLRLVYYTLSQVILLLKMVFWVKRSDIVYINTVLPFAAAFVGKLKGARVIYHIHESSVSPAVLKWFLFKVVAWAADDIINVSSYVASSQAIENKPNHLIYNAIDTAFLEQLLPKEKKATPGNVLMACSLKAYKGVYEFIQLADDHPQFQFRLVLNATQPEINTFFRDTRFSENMEVYPAQKNLHPFYQWADLVVNLSRPDGWIETFGLTIVEGMAYGLPAIVPPVGGILEVIEDGVTGYQVDARNRALLSEKLSAILDNPAQYEAFSKAALKRTDLFKEHFMLDAINKLVQA